MQPIGESNRIESNKFTCHPVRHIFYHKVQKTGSSTFSSILTRMILKENLTAYNLRKPLPHPRVAQWMGDNQDDNNRFDMQVAHGVMIQGVLERIMQRDTVYIATLRHPFRQFISRFYYHYRRNHSHSVSKNLNEYCPQVATKMTVVYLVLKMQSIAIWRIPYFVISVLITPELNVTDNILWNVYSIYSHNLLSS